MAPDQRETAWDAVHEALPARWLVGPALIADPLAGTWHVAAIGPHPGRGKVPQSVVGEGPDEVSALRDLDERLRGRLDTGGRLEELRARMRLAYHQGAEEWTRDNLGRGMTEGELAGVFARVPRRS